MYSSSIYSDMGNYRDFGDTKKVPGLPQDKFAALVRASRAYEADSKTLERLLDGCLARLYTLNDSVAQLGLGDKVGGGGEEGNRQRRLASEMVKICLMWRGEEAKEKSSGEG